MTDTLADAEPGGEPTALGARDYPWWVIAMGLAVLVAFGYSLVSLPHHIALAHELSAAKRLDAAGNYVEAEKHFAVVLNDMPGSKGGRLGMAHALFADGVPDNDPAGLELLAGISLGRDEWGKLAPVMPQGYAEQFTEEKR